MFVTFEIRQSHDLYYPPLLAVQGLLFCEFDPTLAHDCQDHKGPFNWFRGEPLADGSRPKQLRLLVARSLVRTTKTDEAASLRHVDGRTTLLFI